MSSFWRRRAFIIGAVIVAISVGIVFSSIPFLPRTHVSISASTSHSVHGGTQSYLGVYALKIPGVLDNQNLDVQVGVINGTANFCVIQDSIVEPWILSGNGTNGPGSSFPFTSCIVQQQTTQTTLQFTSTSQGTWDIVALNSNPTPITVDFNPA
jgi:tetrahydromethanopterin S-methyltransferase subunit C